MSSLDEAIKRGALIAAVGSVVLALSCFLPWWEQGGGIGEFMELGTGSNTYSAFEKGFIALIVIGCAIGALILSLKIRSGQVISGMYKSGVVVLGVVAALFVLLGVLSPPEPTFADTSLGDPASPVFGIWVALVASLAIVVGGFQIFKGANG